MIRKIMKIKKKTIFYSLDFSYNSLHFIQWNVVNNKAIFRVFHPIKFQHFLEKESQSIRLKMIFLLEQK